MPGAGLTETPIRKAPSDMLALKPYWGKPAVRDFRGGDGDVGIIRSPVRAIVLLDRTINEILRALGRIEGQLDKLGSLDRRVGQLEVWQALDPSIITPEAPV